MYKKIKSQNPVDLEVIELKWIEVRNMLNLGSTHINLTTNNYQKLP